MGDTPDEEALPTLRCPRPKQKLLDMLHIPAGLIVSEDTDFIELAFPVPERKYIDYEYRLEVFLLLSLRGYTVEVRDQGNFLSFGCRDKECQYQNEFQMVRPSSNPESWTVEQNYVDFACRQHTCEHPFKWASDESLEVLDNVVVQELALAILTTFLLEQGISNRLNFDQSYELRKKFIAELGITLSESYWNDLIGIYYRMKLDRLSEAGFFEIFKDALIQNLHQAAKKKEKRRKEKTGILNRLYVCMSAIVGLSVGLVVTLFSVCFVLGGYLLWKALRDSAKREILRNYEDNGTLTSGTIWSQREQQAFTLTYISPSSDGQPTEEVSKQIHKDDTLGPATAGRRIEILVLPGFPHSGYPREAIRTAATDSFVKKDSVSLVLAVVLFAGYYLFWWVMWSSPSMFFIVLGSNSFSFVYKEFLFLKWRTALLYGSSHA